MKKTTKKKKGGLPTAPSMPKPGSVNAQFMFFGNPDIGKTTLLERLAPGQTFILSFDGGTEFMTTMRANIGTYKELDKQIKLLEKAKAEGTLTYEQIGVDPVDAMALICAEHIITKYNSEKGTDVMTLGDTYAHGKCWAMYKKLLRSVYARLARLGCVVTYIAQEAEKEKPINGIDTVCTQPHMDRSTWDIFLPLMHLVGRMSWKKIKTTEGKKKTIRVLQTVQQSSDLITKDKTNRLKPTKGWEQIDTVEDVEKFKKSFEKGNSNGKENKKEGVKEKRLKKKGRKKVRRAR